MTPLEEKIYRKAEMLLNDFKNGRVNFSEAIETIQSIATQAVEEYREKIRNSAKSLDSSIVGFVKDYIESLRKQGFDIPLVECSTLETFIFAVSKQCADIKVEEERQRILDEVQKLENNPYIHSSFPGSVFVDIAKLKDIISKPNI